VRVPGIPQELGQDLVIRACTADRDVERVAALNGEIHGPAEGEAVRRWLIEGHPQLEPSGWLFVEDQGGGQAVATLSLMPLTWRFGPASLPVAELGFVATRPAYRRRGLQRTLSAAFDRIALANGYALAAIEGIPYFYRQFGYEYALPLFDSRFDLALDQIPAGPLAPYAFRSAGPADVPHLMAFYRQGSADLVITTERSEAMWHYYLNMPPEASFGLQLYLISHDGHEAGYLALAPSGWANRLNLVELSLAGVGHGWEVGSAVESALRFARGRAEEGGHESVGLQLPAGHAACRWARERGHQEEGVYGWQMKVLDPVRFLNAIAPLLEGRLAASALGGYSGELRFNLYQLKVGLRLDGGRVSALALEPEADTDVNLPPFAATQLWLGWKSFAALDDWHKDVGAKEEKHTLLEVLFPPLLDRVHIYLGY
jgi:predicted N-acetyltransferase YhbS